MGVKSYFVKATGDCRIVMAKVREYIEQDQHRGWILRFITNEKDKTDEEVSEDEEEGSTTTTTHHNEEEFITLEQAGKALSGSRLYGYWRYPTIWDLYLLYQTMSMNGRQCYKSEIELDIPKYDYVYWMFQNTMLENPELQKKIESKFNRVKIKGTLGGKNLKFSSRDEMLTFFKPYRINPYHNVPIMKIVTKGFHDVKILIDNSDDDAAEEETVNNTAIKNDASVTTTRKQQTKQNPLKREQKKEEEQQKKERRAAIIKKLGTIISDIKKKDKKSNSTSEGGEKKRKSAPSEPKSKKNSRTKKQKVLSNEEPCRLYFLADDWPIYIYFEFLPYGRGIRIAETRDLPSLGSDDDDDDEYLEKKDFMALLKQTRDDAFSWSTKTLLY